MCPFLYKYFKFSNNNFIFLLCFHKIVNTKGKEKEKEKPEGKIFLIWLTLISNVNFSHFLKSITKLLHIPT